MRARAGAAAKSGAAIRPDSLIAEKACIWGSVAAAGLSWRSSPKASAADAAQIQIATAARARVNS